MTQKIVISKSGFNAITETDPNNLVFSSDYNTLKYYASGSISLTIPDGSGTPSFAENTFTHNLGYYPFFVTFVDEPGSSPAKYYFTPVTFAFMSDYLYLLSYVSTTQLIVRGEHTTTEETYVFYYKIYRNNLNL